MRTSWHIRIGCSIVLAVGILAVPAPSSHADTFYVSTSGDDANDGLSWGTAKRTVQGGIDAASEGDSVWVSAGEYVENITLQEGVAVYGGFAGGEIALGERDWETNVTVIDGGGAGAVVTALAGITLAARIDGFTIRNGSGGIYCDEGSPTVANNVITECYSGAVEGGVHCYQASPAILGNTIAANSSMSGAGVYCAFGSPTIEGNVISGNSAGSGGGIWCVADAVIANNTIVGNWAQWGGGIFSGDFSPDIRNNTIVGNAAYAGGGIACYGPPSDPVIVGNTIVGNEGCSGGGIYDYEAMPALANNIVAFNSSGIYSQTGDYGVLSSNCVYGNTHGNYLGLPDHTGTAGNISVDPLLASLEYGDLHIQGGSLCRDGGDGGYVTGGEVDMDGEPRVQDVAVDIGADESDGTVWDVTRAAIRVSPSGDDGNDGSSWALAKQTVQSAVDQAVADGGGEVWAASGQYDERISLQLFTYVYGGFAGDETERSERNWFANQSILDGGAQGTVVKGDNLGHRLSAIDGFVIRNGRNYGMDSGSGIDLDGASPLVANCTIIENRAQYGGGVKCDHASAPLIANCVIARNCAGTGGGLYCSSYWEPSFPADPVVPVMVNTVVQGNSVMYDGGAIYCWHASPEIINDTLVGNGAADRGAGICILDSDATGWEHASSSSPTLVNSIVAFNSSGFYLDEYSDIAVRNTCTYGNAAYDYQGMADPTGSDGNISLDPKLASLAYPDCHIQSDSPCRNAGDNAYVEPGWVDMDGETRIEGGVVDIGADESDGTSWTVIPTFLFVSPTGSDGNDGSSWSAALQTVQAAVDQAAAEGGGEVWVVAGTYSERITLAPAVYLYGGFDGTEGERSARDWEGNPTILDGGAAGSVVTCDGRLGYSASAIDGFTIQNGRSVYGAGVFCEYSSPRIENCRIIDNTATPYGGGMYFSGSCATVSNCEIGNNVAQGTEWAYGGGVYASSCSLTLLSNRIWANSATTYGGALDLLGGSGVIANNRVWDNSSLHGGGVTCRSAWPHLANNTIVANTASGDGGGLYFWCSEPFHQPNRPVVKNNIVAFNSSGVASKPGSSSDVGLGHNCVYGNADYDYSGVDPGASNVLDDPCLADAEGADFHLLPGSPCIEAGDDSATDLGWVDIDGEPRVYGAHVDIGADEYVSPRAGSLLEVHPNERGQGYGGGPKLGTQCWTSSGLTGPFYLWKVYQFDGSANLWIQVCAQNFNNLQNSSGKGDMLQLKVDGQVPDDVWGIMTGWSGVAQWRGDNEHGDRYTLEFQPPGLSAGQHVLKLAAKENPIIWWIKVTDLEETVPQ